MSKKAQLGNILSLPYAALFLALIIVLYSFGTIAAKTFLDSPEKVNYISLQSSENNLLLQIISIELNDGSKKEVLVYDAVYFWLNGKMKTQVLHEEIKLDPLLNEKNDCYYLGVETAPGAETYLQNNKELTMNLKDALKEKIQMTKIEQGGSEIKIRHYFGPCPKETK